MYKVFNRKLIKTSFAALISLLCHPPQQDAKAHSISDCCLFPLLPSHSGLRSSSLNASLLVLYTCLSLKLPSANSRTSKSMCASGGREESRCPRPGAPSANLSIPHIFNGPGFDQPVQFSQQQKLISSPFYHRWICP